MIGASSSVQLQSGCPLDIQPASAQTATQTISKSTAVTINSRAGTITMHNAQLNNNTIVTFGVVNSMCNTDDIIIVNHVESVGSMGNYIIQAGKPGLAANGVATGFQISVRNVSGLAKSEAIKIRFVLIRATPQGP